MKHSNVTAPALMTPCVLCRLLLSSPSSSRRTKLLLPFLAPAVLARSTTTTTAGCHPRVSPRKPGALPPAFTWSKRPYSRFHARRFSSLEAITTSEYSPELVAATPENIQPSVAPSKPPISKSPERNRLGFVSFSPNPLDFSEEEQEQARRTIVTHQRNAEAFDRLFPRGASRRPTYTYPLLFQAIAHVQRQIRTTIDELEYFVDRLPDTVDLRQNLRDFLSQASREKGWAPEATLWQMDEILSYLILERKALRLARRVWRDYCQKTQSASSGNLFDLLVVESLRVAETPFQRTIAAQNCVDALSTIEHGNIMICQETVYQLVKNIPATSLVRLCNTFIRNRIFLGENTTLHVVDCLIEEVASTGPQLVVMACSLLESLPASFRRQQQFAFGCYRVFYAAMRFMPNRDDIRDRILTLLKPSGGLRNEILYTFTLTSAVHQGDERMMKEILDLMLTAGLKPTPGMYNILYWHFKMKGDPERRNAVLRERADADREAQRPLFDDYVKSDIVHAMALEKMPYYKVFQTYSQYFQNDLLYTLRIGSPRVAPSEGKHLRPPNPVVLHTMYRRWLNSPKDYPLVWRAYVRYKEMLNDLKVGPLLIKIGPILPLAFMRSIAQRTYDHAVRVELVSAILQDMLHRKSPVKPTEYHWGYLELQLEVSGNMTQAEKVLQIMTERGMRIPQQVWSSLARGYVREGNPFMAGDVLRRMIDAGGELTESATIWISRIEDRDEFMRGLDGGNAQPMEMDGEQNDSSQQVVTSAGSGQTRNAERPSGEDALGMTVDDTLNSMGGDEELDKGALSDVKAFFNVLGLDDDGKVSDREQYMKWKRVVDSGIAQRIKKRRTEADMIAPKIRMQHLQPPNSRPSSEDELCD